MIQRLNQMVIRRISIMGIIAMIVSTPACKKHALAELLVNCEYWDSYSQYDKRIIGCYEFKKDGECNFYYYFARRDKNGKRIMVREKMTSEYERPVVATWSTQGDSVVVLQGRKWWIASYSKDTILIKSAPDSPVALPLINYKINDVLNRGLRIQ